MNRRSAIKHISTLPLVVFGARHSYSEENNIKEIINSHFKSKPLYQSNDIRILFTDKLEESITLKDCELRGSYLRTTVISKLDNTNLLSLIHESGNQIICSYKLAKNCLPEITTSIRSFMPGNIIAVVEAENARYYNYSYIHHGFACYQGG